VKSIALFLLFAAFICHFVLACTGNNQALVHLSFPKQFQYVGSTVISGDGTVSINADLGLHTLQFRQGPRKFASVIEVASGGECYLTLEDRHIAEVAEVKEAR
jgi:hypothetical protein